MKDYKPINALLLILIAADLLSGLGIAWIDSRPGWDDTGITVGLLFLVAFLTGFIYPGKLWLWGLITGLWIPLFDIVKTGNFTMLIVLAIPIAGSFGGGFLRMAFRRKTD